MDRAFCYFELHSLKVIVTERAIKLSFTQAALLEIYVLNHMDINHFCLASRSILFHHGPFSSLA